MTVPSDAPRFIVPPASKARLLAELQRDGDAVERGSLLTLYHDTPDGDLARIGLAWETERQNRRWIQTLRVRHPADGELAEHSAVGRGAIPDRAAHGGAPLGQRLQSALDAAAARGTDVQELARAEFRMVSRRVRTRGAAVDVTFAEGRLVNGTTTRRVRCIEFEVASGSEAAALAMVRRWRDRYGLIGEPRSRAELAQRLMPRAPNALRKARSPGYADEGGAQAALSAVVGECLDQIARNAVELCDGDAAARVEHVHQLRVGIRRLRSAFRAFDGWVAAPPPELLDRTRTLFAALGTARDSDVLSSGVAVALAAAGAPPIDAPASVNPMDLQALMAADDTQRLLLDWHAWLATLRTSSSAVVGAMSGDAEPPFRERAGRRLKRWHARIARDVAAFDSLDEAALHALRKRIKRQRYAVEFFGPALRRRAIEKYLKPLAAAQERMGELNDLFVARQRYLVYANTTPPAWFAVGWLAARSAELRAAAGPALQRLAKAAPPM